jgi:hypothetical protein
MSEFTLTYSLASDFDGTVNTYNLINTLRSSLTTICTRIDTCDDAVKVVFESEPTANEMTIIGTLINDRDDAIIYPVTDVHPFIGPYSTYNSAFTRVMIYPYAGDLFKKLLSIKFNSYMQNGAVNYTIRVVASGGSIIGEKTLTNTSETEYDLGTLTNVPTDRRQLEVHLKVTQNGAGQKKLAVVSNLTFNLNK